MELISTCQQRENLCKTKEYIEEGKDPKAEEQDTQM